ASADRCQAGSGLFRLVEVYRRRIDAIAQPRRPRSIGKDVAEMALAPCAAHLGTNHAVAGIAMLGDHRRVGGGGEARPAAARIIFGSAFEQLDAAAGATIGAAVVVV